MKSNKIPTAEDISKDIFSGLTSQYPNKEFSHIIDYCREQIIEFAKLHVEAALKEASEKVEMLPNKEQDFRMQNCGCIDFIIDKNSILNSYPLIKIE